MQIAFENPDQPDVHTLVEELDRYLYSIYPAEAVYALDIASLAQPGVLFAVARDASSAPLGCAAVMVNPAYGEIKRMYVRPQARGQGVGRKLMQTLETAARAHGCPALMLETGPHQPEALALYERLGFHHRGPFGDYPADPLSVFMARELS